MPRPEACIIDGMSLVHRLNADQRTFGDLADMLFSVVLQVGFGCSQIDIVFDAYRTISIKNTERDLWGSADGILCDSITLDQKIRQGRKLLRCSESKAAIINFLAEEWKRAKYAEWLGDTEIYISTELTCYRLCKDGPSVIMELKSNQEEADTKCCYMHSMHAKTANQ